MGFVELICHKAPPQDRVPAPEICLETYRAVLLLEQTLCHVDLLVHLDPKTDSVSLRQSKVILKFSIKNRFKYLDNPSCGTPVVGLRSDYGDALAVLDLSDPPYPGDSTDYPLLQKNVVDKWMNGTDRN